MAIVRWDPFDAFLGAQEDLNRMFRRDWLPGPTARGKPAEGGTWAPAVDIYETGEALVVEAELPGVSPDEIDVSVDDGVLTISGERLQEREVKEENFYRIERAHGVFQRSIRLPAEVDADKVAASFENGVLKVKVPKTAPKQPKSIKVQIEGKPKAAGKKTAVKKQAGK